ncbi:MAG: hypothetical protein ACC645_15035, partial [Pirellulales bacterium]
MIRVDVSSQLLLTSVDPFDLTVDGVPATDVAVVDSDTLAFTLPQLAGDVHQVAIATGALVDLRGQPIAPYASTLTIEFEPLPEDRYTLYLL